MTNGPAVDDAFRVKHWEQLRAEMNQSLARVVELERYALLSTGAIWTALAATTGSDWDPVIKWLPLVLNTFFALRALGFVMRMRELARHLVAAERHFGLPPEVASEERSTARRLTFITALVFWPLLLATTFVLPFFYVEQEAPADNENNPSLTLQSGSERLSTSLTAERAIDAGR
jgi:hypothetical protein